MSARRTIHICPVGTLAALCGRTAKGGRFHKSWPICKTCDRSFRKSGGRLITYYNADGWSVSQPVTSNSSTNSLSLNWTTTSRSAA